jgi:phosphoribosylformylglycinamidine synthase subunit PurQ / glutaminase
VTSAGIVVFPGSNCEQDCERSLSGLDVSTEMIWHAESALPDIDVVVLPGGFAHGDYLRAGAIARFSPVMDAVKKRAESGGLVLGICNGFQILCEAGMLPGALRKNAGLKFLCEWTEVRVENADTPFTATASTGDVLKIPINHFDGNWYCSSDTLQRLRDNGQIVLRYVQNPNGSLDSVAGLCNRSRNVFGLMPHPERACDPTLGSQDGQVILSSMLDHASSSLA